MQLEIKFLSLVSIYISIYSGYIYIYKYFCKSIEILGGVRFTVASAEVRRSSLSNERVRDASHREMVHFMRFKACFCRIRCICRPET